MKNEKWSVWLVWQFRKIIRVGAFWVDAGVIPWLHSASGMLQTTAYLLSGHMAPNYGILDFTEKWKVIFLAGLTILKNRMGLGILSACGVNPAVALLLRNAADYRLPCFKPHGTKLGHSWFQWKRKSDFSCWLSYGCTGPQNAVDYRLLIFGPHGTKRMLQTTTYLLLGNGTKLGHSWFHWKMKSDFSGWLSNSRKGNSRKGDLSANFWMWGWSRDCTRPQECCRLPTTYFWTTWYQTTAFLISVNNEKWFFWLVWQFWKSRCVWALWVIAGLILRLHSASGMLQITAYLLLDYMAPH